ncbi:MAG TPA: LuxR C-terminal-related transcriptional regulator [bacterium]|nr:LuxR C-terminal-related transcriptional regulator [bacterium]
MTARMVRRVEERTEEGMLRELAHLATARERMLRELALISRDRAGAAAPQPHGVVQEVLAEIDVEGATYRLSRLRERPSDVDVTPRELEIARLVGRGLATKEISVHLGISSWTVLTHLRRLFTRLGVNTRSAMVKRLSDEGML